MHCHPTDNRNRGPTPGWARSEPISNGRTPSSWTPSIRGTGRLRICPASHRTRHRRGIRTPGPPNLMNEGLAEIPACSALAAADYIPLFPGCSDEAQQWKHESPRRGDWLVGSAVFCQNARFALPAPWTVPHRRTFLVSSLYHRGSSRTSLGFRCWPQGKTGQALDTMWYNQGAAVVPGQTLFSAVRIRNVRPFCRGGHSSTRRKRE
jgi:hypothetical protein